MKLFRVLLLIVVAISLNAYAEDNIWDIVEKAQKTIIQKYPDESSIARKMAIEELEKIARSDKSEKEKIAVILEKYPSVALLSVNSENTKKEIDAVIAKMNKIDEKIQARKDSKKKTLELMAREISQIRAIDTSRCPQDFRVAVEQFVSAYESFRICFAAKPEGFSLLLTDIASYKNDYMDKLNKYCLAGDNINIIAAKYGAKEKFIYDSDQKDTEKKESEKKESEREKNQKEVLERLRKNK